MKKILAAFLVAILFWSCDEPVRLDVDQGETRVVIEGLITNLPGYQYIKLSQTGGFYDQGFYFAGGDTISIIKHSKNWWAQAEGLHTLLVFARMYPADANDYRIKFSQLWDYIQKYLVDHEHGDWYEEGIDHDPAKKTSAKSHIWKATYHNFRSLSNCIRMLKSGIPGNAGDPAQHNPQ